MSNPLSTMLGYTVIVVAGGLVMYIWSSMTNQVPEYRGEIPAEVTRPLVATQETKPEEETEEEDLLSTYWAGAIPEDCEEILDMLRYPELFTSYGSKMPKGLLLHGEPGTGKTYFGKMLADLANAHFFYAAASQMDEVYVGSGPKKIRALFEKAKKAAAEGKNPNAPKQSKGFLNSLFQSGPDHEISDVDSMEVKRGRNTKPRPPKTKSIIFLDELDSLGLREGYRHSDARHGTLSQLLACMDGIIESDDVFVIAATNYLQGIDPALTRSGRFDRMIKMGRPNKDSRVALLEFYLKKKPICKNILTERQLIEDMAKAMEGFNAPDVANTINEATLRATRDAVAFLKKRHLKSSSKVDVPTEEPEPQLTVEHLVDAFWSVHKKILAEHQRPELLRQSVIRAKYPSLTAPPSDLDID